MLYFMDFITVSKKCSKTDTPDTPDTLFKYFSDLAG